MQLLRGKIFQEKIGSSLHTLANEAVGRDFEGGGGGGLSIHKVETRVGVLLN